MQGKTVEDTIENTQNKYLKKHKQKIIDVAKGTLSETDIFLLKQMSHTIAALTVQIQELETRMAEVADKEALEIICSVPGIGRLSGATILAELGDIARFSNGRQVASWCGFAPFVSQSAGVTRIGHITKVVRVGYAGLWLRWLMLLLGWIVGLKRCFGVLLLEEVRMWRMLLWLAKC